jgi:hypothetical protein
LIWPKHSVRANAWSMEPNLSRSHTSRMGYATRIKKHDLYRGYANVTTRRFRDELDLDNPKYIPGDDPHAVVSNFDHA